jgi:molybdopterin molybdotransferase
MVLSFEKALLTVKEKLSSAVVTQVESAPLERAWRRVLAEDVAADRDYPPFHRSARDGYAVRVSDVQTAPASLELAGEVRAGRYFQGKFRPGTCVRVMTGAPLPEGTESVVMLEDTQSRDSRIEILKPVADFENVVRRGAEAARGNRILGRGTRLDAGDLGLLASVGKSEVAVFRKPVVSILSTGDEVLPVAERPEWFQIRNSNGVMLSALVESAGGIARELGVAPDDKEILRQKVRDCFETDLVLITGGVSAGKYDYVEDVLGELGAEFYFDGVSMRPGKPLVFGRALGKLVFGLPGNPVSAFVTFCVFARPAIQAAGGSSFERPVFLRAQLEAPIRHRSGLTTFIPAQVHGQAGEPMVRLVGWQGSGDLAGLAKANCFVVAHPLQPEDLPAGEWVDVLPKPV